MAVTNFIPEVWSDAVEDRWVDRGVLPNLVNRDHEGEATKGNVVHLTGILAPSVRDYKANGRISTPDAVSDTGWDLLIDQEKDFAFYVDDVDRAQAAGSMDAYTEAAGDGLVTDANEFLAGLLAAGGTALPGAAPTTGDQAYDLIKTSWVRLKKAKAPDDNRILLANAEYAGMLLGADSKLTSFDTSGDTAGLRDATIGRLLQYRVVVSEDLPETDGPAFVAFHGRAASFVGQIVQVESLRAQNKFADIVRGLHVYGGVVTKPQGVQVFGINTGTLTGTPRSEVWSLTITGGPTGGTYTLTVGSVATAPIAHNASNAAIATALNALAGVSEVAVTGSATSKEIRFKVDVGLTATSSLTGGTTPAVTVTAL